jgi:hypothetical protein
VEPAPAAVVIIVDNQDIWLVLAQAQLARDPFRVLAVVLVLLVVDMVVDSLPVVVLLVDPVLLLAISVEDQITLPGIVKPKL